jgi:hypothetical protein
MTDKQLLQRILSRCKEDGGCLLWPGAMADGTCPQMRVKGKTVNVRRKHFELTVGPIPAGMVVAVTCECQRCIRHVEPQTTAQVSQRVAASGVFSTQAHAAKIAAGKRKRSKFSDEAFELIRESEELGTVLAERLGMNHSYLCRARRGIQRKDYNTPWAGLGG